MWGITFCAATWRSALSHFSKACCLEPTMICTSSNSTKHPLTVFLGLIAGLAIHSSGLAESAEITTIAGTGVKGYQPEQSVALKTPVAEPYGIAIGPDGSLYICEIAASVVRKLDLKTGQLALVAGTGEAGYSGDGGVLLLATGPPRTAFGNTFA